MKLVERNEESLTLALRQRERELLVFLLRLYPALDPAYQKLSKATVENHLEAAQEFLTESLTAEQNSNRQLIDQFIRGRLTPSHSEGGSTLRLTLTLAEVDWLLRVINNVRVGCWTRLGRPEPPLATALKTGAQHVTELAAIELGMLVQDNLLEALNG
jgi:hypothetical protein